MKRMSTIPPGLAMLRAEGVRPGAERQLECWEGNLREGLAGRSSPLFEATLSWLHAELPPRLPSSSHGVIPVRAT